MNIEMPPVPTEGPFGKTVESSTVSQSQEVERFYVRAPSPPCREIYSWNESLEYWQFSRNRTDQEMEDAQKLYEESLERWKKTGGVIIRPCGIETECEVKFTDGSAGRALWDGRSWRWIEVTAS